jgi:hypothetical protein
MSEPPLFLAALAEIGKAKAALITHNIVRRRIAIPLGAGRPTASFEIRPLQQSKPATSGQTGQYPVLS